MNKIRIVLMLGFLWGIFLASGDWANSQCPHETPKDTPAQAPVRTDIPTRPSSDSSRPVDSGQFDGVPKGKSNQADSDKLNTLSDIEKLEKQYLKQVDKKKDTEEGVSKQSAQKAPWYSSIWNRTVDVYDRAVVNNTNKSIANKKAKLERVNADVEGWERELAKQNVERFMDDAALNQGRDFKKKNVLNMNAQRKVISGQMDDVDGNITAIQQHRDKAKAQQTQLKKEIAGLEAKVATIQSKNKSVTPVSSIPYGRKPSAGPPSVAPSTGRSERDPATGGYAPPPRAR